MIELDYHTAETVRAVAEFAFAAWVVYATVRVL